MARRRKAALAGSALMIAVVAAAGACTGNGVATSGRTIPASCEPLHDTAATPGTDASGSSVPGTTVPGKPTVSMPQAPVTDLQKIDLRVGDGAEVKEGDTVSVHYVGVSCSTGVPFDSSWETGNPVDFPLANVIKGWGQGMVGMKVGGQRELIVPPDLGYGASPPSSSPIAKNETLVFVVDLLGTAPTPATTTTAAPETTTTAVPQGATAPGTSTP